MFKFDDDDFISKWISLEACDEQQADYILMKIIQQIKRCKICTSCLGTQCDIYTSCEDEAMLGKYLIHKQINERKEVW